jgi:anti-sigma B factor antagonist
MSEPNIIEPPAELDVATVPEFRSALGEAVRDAGAGLVIDLSHVEFIDSTGLGAVLEARERARTERLRFAVVAPRGTAAAVLLTLSGLRSRLPVFESRGAAVRAAQRPAA